MIYLISTYVCMPKARATDSRTERMQLAVTGDVKLLLPIGRSECQ